MEIKVDEISKIIRQQIEGYDKQTDLAEVGSVISVGDGIARIYGLEKVMAGELLELPHGVMGLALNLEEDNVGAVLLGEAAKIKEGDQVAAPAGSCRSPPATAVLGRVVDPLGIPLDGKGPISDHGHDEHRAHRSGRRRAAAGDRAAADGPEDDRQHDPDRPRPARVDHRRPPDRQDRHRPRHDHQPEGQGRHLHLRRHRPEAVDHRPGRQDARRQRRDGLHRSSSPPRPRPRRRCSTWRPTPAAPWASTSCTTAPTATGSADNPGRAVLCIYDDLSKHAAAYREISLLLRRPPGREAYPGDVFYLHSRLLERAAKLNDDKNGGGSLTALPIIETQAGDISAYIPTNVISITDGQIFLESDLFYAGCPTGHERRPVGLPRRRQRPDQGDEAGRRHACAWTWPSTASWRPSPSSARTSTRRPRRSSTAASAWWRCSSRASTSRCRREAGPDDLRRHQRLSRRPGRWTSAGLRAEMHKHFDLHHAEPAGTGSWRQGRHDRRARRRSIRRSKQTSSSRTSSRRPTPPAGLDPGNSDGQKPRTSSGASARQNTNS